MTVNGIENNISCLVLKFSLCCEFFLFAECDYFQFFDECGQKMCTFLHVFLLSSCSIEWFIFIEWFFFQLLLRFRCLFCTISWPPMRLLFFMHSKTLRMNSIALKRRQNSEYNAYKVKMCTFHYCHLHLHLKFAVLKNLRKSR